MKPIILTHYFQIFYWYLNMSRIRTQLPASIAFAMPLADGIPLLVQAHTGQWLNIADSVKRRLPISKLQSMY